MSEICFASTFQLQIKFKDGRIDGVIRVSLEFVDLVKICICNLTWPREKYNTSWAAS